MVSLQQQTAVLSQTFSEVLANLAFMFATNEPPADPVPSESWLETTIGYRGPLCGTLHMRCTGEFGRALAANLLGVDPEDDDVTRKAEDSVKELMNVFCGQFVTCMYGLEAVFDLTIPKMSACGEHAPTDEAPAPCTTLIVDGQPIQIWHTPEVR